MICLVMVQQNHLTPCVKGLSRSGFFEQETDSITDCVHLFECCVCYAFYQYYVCSLALNWINEVFFDWIIGNI